MDSSVTPNEIFSSEDQILVTERYNTIRTLSFITVSSLVIIIVVYLNTVSKYEQNLQQLIVILSAIFGLFTLLALFMVPYTWNVVIVSSEGIQFIWLTKRVVFKWSEIRSCSFSYSKQAHYDYKKGRRTPPRKYIIKVTPVEGDVQSMTIRVILKFRDMFRVKEGEKVIDKFMKNIVNCFTIKPKETIGDFKYYNPGEYYYCWVIQEGEEEREKRNY